MVTILEPDVLPPFEGERRYMPARARVHREGTFIAQLEAGEHLVASHRLPGGVYAGSRWLVCGPARREVGCPVCAEERRASAPVNA